MKRMILCALLAAAPHGVSAGSAVNEESFRCDSEDGSAVVVRLWKPSGFNEPLHCLQADFIVGMTPCAPNGGWGLSSDTTGAELTEITSDWKTAHEHQAGKVTAISGPRAVMFNAQRGKGIGNNLSYEWKFSVQRRTGEAVWASRDGKKRAYRCHIAG